MRGILKNLFSSVTGEIIYGDLSRLNKLGDKIGDRAAEFVKSGAAGTVVSTLANTNVPAELLSPPVYGQDKDTAERKRRSYFLDADPYDPALMARYAEVLAAAQAQSGGYRLLAGPKTAEPRLRIFFGEAFAGAKVDIHSWPGRARKEPILGLTPDMAIRIGAEFDVAPEEVLAILLWDEASWGLARGNFYRDLVDWAPFLSANADLILRTNKILNSNSRIVLLKLLNKYALCEREPMLSLVFEQAGGTAKTVREAALDILLGLPAEVIEARAQELLETGNASVRLAMVGILAKLGSESTFAALKDHLAAEKSAKVVAAIENVLIAAGVSDDASDGPTQVDDITGYTAIDGTRVAIPGVRPIAGDPSFRIDQTDRQRIVETIEAYNDKASRQNAEDKKAGRKWARRPIIPSPAKQADKTIEMLEAGQLTFSGGHQLHPFFFAVQNFPKLFDELMQKLPLKRQVQVNVCVGHGTFYLNHSLARAPGPVAAWLTSEVGDLRAMEDLLVENAGQVSVGKWPDRRTRPFKRGDMLYQLMPAEAWNTPGAEFFSDAALWPLVAENFAIMDEALGLAPKTETPCNREDAVKLLQRLPKTPLRYFGPLLEIATGETKAGRSAARALLGDVPQVDARLVDLLSDNRQAVRAGAAEWLAARGNAGAIKPMKARLKKEKSEMARAAILTALQDLGEDLSSFVGPAALTKEAEAGLKKAKMDKLSWLELNHLPKLKWGNGRAVPDTVVTWWLFVANKLKQPGGNALLEIYLDQLEPASAEQLSSWVFDSWIAYDTRQRDEAEGIAYAQANVKRVFAQWSQWWKELTEEAAFQMLKSEITGQYLNSGAANKGLLGLATRVPSAQAADRVRQVLKNHGSRTSQTTSLLELLAAKGDAVSLQVVIGAATRLKQKSVQAKAGEMVEAVAEARGWTMQELADRTIPTGGLDDDGIVDLPCGPDAKPYKARLGHDLQLVLSNPDGKVIKALPSSDDDNTKASKKQLSASKKEIKQVIKAQSARLYEGLCAERVWPTGDWLRDFDQHPVMRRLIERVIWLGLDDGGGIQAAFRPTADGECTDVEDNPVDPADFAAVRLAHGALLDDAQATAWKEHLSDYEVKPLFSQFDRALLRLEGEMKTADEIDDRKGWVTDAFTVRGAASKLGYDRGEALDGGYFCEYVKPFKSADIVAVIEFSGNCLPEENVAAAMKTLFFTKTTSGYNGRKLALGDVPPVLLSECWNDYRQMAAKARFDPEWEKKMPW